ncbi:MAG: Abi family protein [Clostridia bacterium]|nr:Abi family protein [Clostridia bacterium]
MEKEFKTISEQIRCLESKNLMIKDKNRTANILEKNNYYYLINGYKNAFTDCNKNGKYIEGTTIEEIYSLYEFDRKIRNVFLEYILLIERKIDTYIAYEFSKEHGYKNYLISDNFEYSEKNRKKFDKFLKDINLEISHQYKNSNKMIVHYINKYKYIPLWVLIRILSFGKVSKFYSFMKAKERNVISKKFNIKEEVLKIYLTNLGEVRNICAHDEKLYDINLRFKISNNEYHSILKIQKEKENYKNGLQDLFSIVIILKVMLEKEQFSRFYKALIKNIQILKKQIHTIEFYKILNKMGFPSNYKKILYL